jgi:hypothetical protein
VVILGAKKHGAFATRLNQQNIELILRDQLKIEPIKTGPSNLTALHD